ncbi:MAG: DUF3810 domain-containing protein [Roseburia sp.]|nr:DUF3810 domain-containing protein [Roseburia sp.]
MQLRKKRAISPLIKRPRRMYTADGYGAQTVRFPMSPTMCRLGAAVCVLGVPLLVMLAVRKDAGTAEWWVRHVQSTWERVMGTLTSWLPVSVLELLIVVLIALGAFLFARLAINLSRARFRAIGVGIAVVGVGVIAVLDLYVMSMGFGYYRAPMPLKQAGADYTAVQAAEAAQYFLDDYNALAVKFERDENGCVICPYTFRELSKLLAAEYSRLDDDYFTPYTPKVKPIVNSWLLSDMLITGVTFLPVGEACVNDAVPPTYATVTMAHELAHTKGVQREGDANLIAQYILLSSSDDYLRYCGYYDAYFNLLSAVRLAGDYDGYMRMGSEINPMISREREYERKYWASQPDIMGAIAEFFNNFYLKSNGVANGTASYGDGNKTEVITPINPDTGTPEINPDTGKPVIVPVYSTLQKIFFYLYENRVK